MQKKNLSSEEAYRRAAAGCARREYCRADWYGKMLAAGLTAAQAEQVLERLQQEHFIDEERYCRSFVHDKLRYDRWGRVKIACALRAKGIASATVDEALAAIDEDEYRGVLSALLAQKARSVQAAGEAERRRKLARFAAGRGFEPSLVFSLLQLEGDD